MQEPLFNDLTPTSPALPNNITEMHHLHGRAPTQQCRTCAYLIRYHKAGRVQYKKCNQARVSHSTATDWRAKWPACGLWQPIIICLVIAAMLLVGCIDDPGAITRGWTP